MVDAGIVSFSRLATFVDGPYLNQVKEVEQYFKYITVTATDPSGVKIGDYQLIEDTDGMYKWLGREK